MGQLLIGIALICTDRQDYKAKCQLELASCIDSFKREFKTDETRLIEHCLRELNKKGY